MKFVEELNSELEQNRLEYPSKEDDEEMRELQSLDEEDKIGFKDTVNQKDGFRKR
jgi:hypothetical protein